VQAASLLEFCLSDLDESDWSSTAQLAGLPLLPLASGRVAVAHAGRPGKAGQAGQAVGVVFVPSPGEAQLFGRHAGDLLVDVGLLTSDLAQRWVSGLCRCSW
jgi:hypothetical protein